MRGCIHKDFITRLYILQRRECKASIKVLLYALRKLKTSAWFLDDCYHYHYTSSQVSGINMEYEGVSKSFRTQSINNNNNTSWEVTKRVMAAKFTILTHKIAIQLHLVAESCIICSSRSRRPVRKLLDTHSYVDMQWLTERIQRIPQTLVHWSSMCPWIYSRLLKVLPRLLIVRGLYILHTRGK
jgi:hypothetical protein